MFFLPPVREAGLTSGWPAMAAMWRAVRPPYPTCWTSAPLCSRDVISSGLSCNEIQFECFVLFFPTKIRWGICAQGVDSLIGWGFDAQRKSECDFWQKLVLIVEQLRWLFCRDNQQYTAAAINLCHGGKIACLGHGSSKNINLTSRSSQQVWLSSN